MIRPLRPDELDRALTIINQAALAYKGVIPPDCWQEPYMPEAELRAEIAHGVDFWGYEAEARLLAVMGRQDRHDAGGYLGRGLVGHPLLSEAGISVSLAL
jgi:hypothetical protein